MPPVPSKQTSNKQVPYILPITALQSSPPGLGDPSDKLDSFRGGNRNRKTAAKIVPAVLAQHKLLDFPVLFGKVSPLFFDRKVILSGNSVYGFDFFPTAITDYFLFHTVSLLLFYGERAVRSDPPASCRN